jgi:hypothetical protein
VFIKTILSAAAVFSLLSTIAQAQEIGYEDTVAHLKAQLKDEPAPMKRNPWETVEMNAGLALAASYVSVAQSGANIDALLKGFDLHMGIDFPNSNWEAEGAFRSFSSERASADYNVSLTELEGKLVHKTEIYESTKLRLGGGLSTRFLKTMDVHGATSESSPALVLLAGIDRKLSSKFSFGPDLTYRTPMSSASHEHGSTDGSLRLNLLF